MDKKTRKFLEGVYPYFMILDNANKKLLELMSMGYDNSLHEAEELFYQILSDLIRLFPIKIPMKVESVDCGDSKQKDYENAKVDANSSILLLKEHIPFLTEKYNMLLVNVHFVKAMDVMVRVRNKCEHEPHNIRLNSMVGGNGYCSMYVHYKNEELPMSTDILANILYDLNQVFEKIKILYMKKIEECDAKYKEYPCYKTISELDLSLYNQKYSYVPWENIINDNVIDEEK